ncbi:MAG: hypothetical protein ACKVT0_12750 [Planctomycetaceae bacterium]
MQTFIRTSVLWAMLAVLVGACTPVANGPNDNQLANDNEQVNENVSTNDNADAVCEPACSENQICQDGGCVQAAQPSIEFGYTDEDGEAYMPIGAGQQMPYFTLGQGGSHTFVTTRVTGFERSADGRLDINYLMIRKADGFALSDFQQRTAFNEIGTGQLEARRRLLSVLDFPEVLEGVEVDFMITVTSPVNAEQTISIDQNQILDFVP